jgi:hypothetical protein
MNANIKNILITICITAAAAMLSGCGASEIVGNLSSETPSEKETPAEFKLGEALGKEGKIAVVVTQPAWIKSPMDLRASLTNSLNAAFEIKAEIKKERLTAYSDIMKIRMSLPEDKKNDPIEIAKKLNAKYVLTVEVQDFDLSTFAEKDFYNGMMAAKACLLDCNGVKLWPKPKEGNEKESSEGYRQTSIEIENEKGTVKSAVEKLSDVAAFCITRYFYNCKADRFRIPEEKRELEQESEKW